MTLTITAIYKPTLDQLKAIECYDEAVAGIPDTLEMWIDDAWDADGKFVIEVNPWGYLDDWLDALRDLARETVHGTGTRFAKAYLNRETKRFIEVRQGVLESLARRASPEYSNPFCEPGVDLIHLDGYYAPMDFDMDDLHALSSFDETRRRAQEIRHQLWSGECSP